MFAYDKTFDPEVVQGHCDLISQFSDFALYLDTQLVYFHTFYVPPTEGGGHIVFGAVPVGVRVGVRVRVASFLRDIF